MKGRQKRGETEKREKGRFSRDGDSFSEAGFNRKPRECRFCAGKFEIQLLDAKALRPFLSEREKILPRRMTNLCAHHQRYAARVVKQARILGIIPFTAAQRETI